MVTWPQLIVYWLPWRSATVEPLFAGHAYVGMAVWLEVVAETMPTLVETMDELVVGETGGLEVVAVLVGGVVRPPVLL